MRVEMTIPARDVRPGDHIFNSMGFGNLPAWVPVILTEPFQNYIVLTTTVWFTFKHPEEAVEVLREQPPALA